MYWFDAIATRNFPYVIRHQNAARGDLAKHMKFAFIDHGISYQIFTYSIRSYNCILIFIWRDIKRRKS